MNSTTRYEAAQQAVRTAEAELASAALKALAEITERLYPGATKLAIDTSDQDYDGSLVIVGPPIDAYGFSMEHVNEHGVWTDRHGFADAVWSMASDLRDSNKDVWSPLVTDGRLDLRLVHTLSDRAPDPAGLGEITLYFVGATAAEALDRLPFDSYESAESYATDSDDEESIWMASAWIDAASIELATS